MYNIENSLTFEIVAKNEVTIYSFKFDNLFIDSILIVQQLFLICSYTSIQIHYRAFNYSIDSFSKYLESKYNQITLHVNILNIEGIQIKLIMIKNC